MIKIRGPRIRIKKPRITIKPPKVTIKPPTVTIDTPTVTVGGDVGRVGDQVLRAGTRVVERHLEAPLIVPNAIIDVVEGKPVDQAVKDAIAQHLDLGIAVVDFAAEVDGAFVNLTARLTDRIGGETAADILADLRRVLQPVPIEQASAILKGVQLFIETGNIDALNPLAILIAAELVSARNQLWAGAAPIPDNVKAVLPAELIGRAGACRYVDIDAVSGNTSLPKIAIDHLKRAKAVCLVDLIVFQVVPGVDSQDDKHYWSHEIYHAQQYAHWGTQKFVTKYVANEMAGGLNPIEEDADVYACSFFPGASPAYIGTCPVPT